MGITERAEAELAIAQRTLPNEARIPLLAAYSDRREGEWNQSLAKLKEALRLDPRNLSILQQISRTYEALHQYRGSGENAGGRPCDRSARCCYPRASRLG